MSERVSETKEIGRAGSILAVFTLISRILGLFRNQILGHFFGAGLAADAFIAAFTFPNAFRRLFGEGALGPAMVSLLSRHLKAKKPENQKTPREAWQHFISNSFFRLSILLIIIAGLGILFAPLVVRLYVPEFAETPGKLELTIQLSRLLFPFILFIGWAAFFASVLNSLGCFGLPAAGPALLNLTVILIVPILLLTFFKNSNLGIFVFGAAILLGGFLQALIQIPKLGSLDALPSFGDFRRFDPHTKELIGLLIPSVFSLGIYQLNLIVNRVFASAFPGGVSHLFYADLLLELPLSLVAVSLGTAVIPSFSRLIIANRQRELADTLNYSLEVIGFFALPAMIGLLSLSLPMISTFYFSGKFSVADTQQTAVALFFYAFGLPFFSGNRILLPLFFADQDTKTPVRAGLLALLVNFFTAYFLSKKMEIAGIAIASSLSALTHFLVLMFIARRKFSEWSFAKLAGKLGKIFLAALLMGILIFGLQQLIDPLLWQSPGNRMLKATWLLGLVASGVLSYFFFCFVLRVPHTRENWQGLRKKLRL